MIDETGIVLTLTKLDELYSKTGDADMLKLYSKISVLEFCGWLEITMDEIVFSFSDRRLTLKDYKQECKEIVKETKGFVYDSHFRKLVYKIIGLYNLEKIETKIEKDILILNQETTLLWEERVILAHTYTNPTRSFKTTPSTVLNGHLKKVLPILKTIQQEIDAIP